MQPELRNGEAIPWRAIPELSLTEFRSTLLQRCRTGARIAVWFAVPATEPGYLTMLAVLADDSASVLYPMAAPYRAGTPFPSLTPELPQASMFERELWEEHAVQIEGHPWLKPVRRHAHAARHDGPALPSFPFYRVDGTGVHEVGVGPVHAGIIEPGHFRFQCHGEKVLFLEIRLGYQHRGLERALLSASEAKQTILAESIAGDTVLGHAIAYAMVREAIAATSVPYAADVTRGMALELERLANHVGDLGALANDVAFLPAAAYLGRLRGDVLNLLLELSGNRFGRSLVVPGGVRTSFAPEKRTRWIHQLATIEADLEQICQLLWETPSVLSRFEHTGVVPTAVASDLGFVGPTARASGVARDVRRDHPAGAYCFAHVPLTLASSGDVFARALVRWTESMRSLQFLQEQLADFEPTQLGRALGPSQPNVVAVAMVEGWRGEIVHVGVTGSHGELSAYKIVDPSFRNWTALAVAVRDGEISDFPLCNKSFNLSYAGHDL